MSEELTIGRSDDNDIVINNPYLSGRHAAISLLDRSQMLFSIRDLDSTNGVFKGKTQVSEVPFSLSDEILLGGYTLQASDFLNHFMVQETTEAAPKVKSSSTGLRTALVLLASISLFQLYLLFTDQGSAVVEPTTIIHWLVIFVLILLAVQVLQVFVGTLFRTSAEKKYRSIVLAEWQQEADKRLDDFQAKAEKSQDAWQGFRKFEVAAKVPESSDITSFYLEPHDKQPLPAFKPGQYLMFNLHIPGQAKPIMRCYSLSDGPSSDHYRVSIKKVPPPRDKPELPWGLSSSYFHEQIEQGAILDVKAPSGAFFLDLEAQSAVVLIAGGVGLTPMVSMLNALTDIKSQRPIWFFYGVRNKAEIAMGEHLQKIAQKFDNVTLQLCFSNPTDEDVKGKDYQHAERVSVDLFKRVLPSNNFDFYMCGPPPMMNSIVDGLEEWGVPDKHVHLEAFGPASVKKDKSANSTASAAVNAKVTFAQSDKVCEWDASKGLSILEMARENNIELDCSCEMGKCGTCLTAIREGSVTYLSEPDSLPEKGSCLTCCSAPNGDLVLDA